VSENHTAAASAAARPSFADYRRPISTGECGLTPREHHVLALVAEGLTNYQIARRLDVSPRTIEKHLEHILEKLNVPSRTAAVAHHAAAGAGHGWGGAAARDGEK
jgi:DNA-binding CsgD family transcriptional regulator